MTQENATKCDCLVRPVQLLAPEVVVDGEKDDPAAAARRIVSALEEKGYLPESASG